MIGLSVSSRCLVFGSGDVRQERSYSVVLRYSRKTGFEEAIEFTCTDTL